MHWNIKRVKTSEISNSILLILFKLTSISIYIVGTNVYLCHTVLMEYSTNNKFTSGHSSHNYLSNNNLKTYKSHHILKTLRIDPQTIHKPHIRNNNIFVRWMNDILVIFSHRCWSRELPLLQLLSMAKELGERNSRGILHVGIKLRLFRARWPRCLN